MVKLPGVDPSLSELMVSLPPAACTKIWSCRKLAPSTSRVACSAEGPSPPLTVMVVAMSDGEAVNVVSIACSVTVAPALAPPSTIDSPPIVGCGSALMIAVPDATIIVSPICGVLLVDQLAAVNQLPGLPAIQVSVVIPFPRRRPCLRMGQAMVRQVVRG